MNRLVRRLFNAVESNKRRKGANRRKKRSSVVVPQTAKQPQRLGIGTTTVRVTRTIQVVANASTDFSLLTYVFESYEFSRQAEDYNFFRVSKINLIQHPLNVNDVDGQVWVLMDWLNDSNDMNTLSSCDNAKLLSYNLTRPLVYTFLPPNARLRYAANEQELGYTDLPINYTEWLPSKPMIATPAPGWLRFLNIGNKPITVTVDTVLEFKGSKPYDSSFTLKEMVKMKKHIVVKPYQKVEVEAEMIAEPEEEEEIDDMEEKKMEEKKIEMEEKKIEEKKKKVRK